MKISVWIQKIYYLNGKQSLCRCRLKASFLHFWLYFINRSSLIMQKIFDAFCRVFSSLFCKMTFGIVNYFFYLSVMNILALNVEWNSFLFLRSTIYSISFVTPTIDIFISLVHSLSLFVNNKLYKKKSIVFHL
jgi:hypothetical protein